MALAIWPMSATAHNGTVAVAIPLQGISIDGAWGY